MGVSALSLGFLRDEMVGFGLECPGGPPFFGPRDVRRMTRAGLSHMSCRIDDGSTILELGEDMALSLTLRGIYGSFFFIIISPRKISIASHLALHLHT
jgi:hypothetical protein